MSHDDLLTIALFASNTVAVLSLLAVVRTTAAAQRANARAERWYEMLQRRRRPPLTDAQVVYEPLPTHTEARRRFAPVPTGPFDPGVTRVLPSYRDET